MSDFNIIRTIFTNVNGLKKTFGYRAFNKYNQTYCNALKEGDVMGLSGLEFLKFILDNTDDTIEEMIGEVRDNKEGIHIDYEYFTWEQIKNIIGE